MGAETIVAVILAAGRSSRMGDFKPLLPFGGRSLIAQVAAAFREARVAQIHVVAGFRAEALAPELARLGLIEIRNDAFDRGMFSSVQAAVAALPASAAACLLAPVDAPLLRVSTIERIVAAAAKSDAAVIYPNYRGVRGHPPLIRRALFAEILAGEGVGGLQALLARHQHAALDVDVFDIGCLVDIDTPEDYRRCLVEFVRHHLPNDEECEAMLAAASAPEPVRRHCRAVAALATNLSRRLRDAGEPLDTDFVRAAAWLHDIAKGAPHHAEAGAMLVSGFGFPELAPAVARHMQAPEDATRLDEGSIVYLADKLVQGERAVSLEARFGPALARFADDREALAGARRRFAGALALRAAIEARIGGLYPVLSGAAP